MKKRVFIIHGWTAGPEGGWRTWIKNELADRGYEVFAPAMPNTNHPKMEEWVSHLRNVVGEPDENCFFVGHSLGCITILRYLETLKEHEKIGGAFLVAGFSGGIGFPEIRSFYAKPPKWGPIKARCKKFVAISSDNDDMVPLEKGMALKEKLGAKLIVVRGMGHITEDIAELPVLLDEILAAR